MTIAVVVLCVVLVAFFLLKKDTPVEDTNSVTKSPSIMPSMQEKGARTHTKMDVPMIRSRFEKLNATDGLTEHAKKKLDKIILNLCSGEEEIYWWEPLRRFSQLPNASKGAKFMFVNAHTLEGQRLTEFILNLSEMIRFCGLRFSGIETADGEKISGFQLDNGAYNVHSVFGEDKFTINLDINDDEIDIPTFITSVNNTLAKKKATHRIVQFAPDGPVYCLLCTGYTEYKLSERFV